MLQFITVTLLKLVLLILLCPPKYLHKNFLGCTSLFGHSLSSSIYKTESMIQFIPVPLLKFGIG